MFPLYTKTLPSTASELIRLLNASLARVFSGISEPVSIRADAYPDVAELRVALDGAELRKVAPPKVEGSSTPALNVETMHVHGSEMSVGPVSVDLDLAAKAVRLEQSRDANGDIVLVLAGAKEGHVEVSASKDAIEQAIAQVAK